MAFPSNAPFGEIFGEIPTRSPSPPRLVYSYPAGYKHRVDSSDSNPSSSQSAGKEISDHEQLRHVDRSTQPARSMISRSTPYVCHHPGCDTPCTRRSDLRRHMKYHRPNTKHDCPYGAKVGSFCKRVGENGFIRKDHLLEHLRRVHDVDVPESSRGMRASLNDNQLSKGEIEQHSEKDATNISALATVVEQQQDEERQPKLERSFDDRGGNAHSDQGPDLALASNVETDFRHSGSVRRRVTKLMSSPTIPGYGRPSEVADPLPIVKNSRLHTSMGRPSIVPLQQAARSYSDTNSSVSGLDPIWDLNDEAMTVSSSGSSNPEEYACSNNETGGSLTQLTPVSNVAMIPAVRDSRDMTGVASQLTSEWVAKESFGIQPSDTSLDGVVLGSLNGIVSEQQAPSRAFAVTDAPLRGSREIGQFSPPSEHEEAEKPYSALEGQVANAEAAFDSAIFHLNNQEYRKAKRVLRQLPRIHKNGDSDYKAKLYLLLAKAYQGQDQLEKAKGFASVSLDERHDLHGEIHPLVEESAELLIAILIGLGNNMEADALQKIHCPRRSYTAAFVGLATKVGTIANPLSCSMILRRSSSILEHTQQWLLNSKLLSLLVRTVFPEKPLAAGKTRVRWTCSCGQRLFDDFIETRPGAAEELRVALDTFDRQRPTSHYPAYPAASYQSYSGSTNMSGNPTRDSATSPAGAVNPNFTTPRSIYDPPPTSGGLFSTNLRRDEPPESKWLLICAQAWRQPTSLLQLDVCSTTSDKQLFRDLRRSYLELKRAWWHRLSLKVVQSIRFVQFELHPSDLVDVRKVPDMPPAERHDEYLYQRVELIPPIGENMMTHWFHHPHKANDQATTFMRSPKKRKLRLAICPKMGTNIGWGIQLVEGWAMFKLWLLALVISFLGGMVFAVTWAVMKHDIQGAVAVAAYFVALAGLVVGTVQAYLH